MIFIVKFRFSLHPVLGDIKSRCKITAFFANACAYIKKKCVKIDTFYVFVTFYTYFTPFHRPNAPPNTKFLICNS